ncbi:amino acid transporter [Neonectria punicea]|uniref:Amino acid transporter n=1 Tax=Neonectria punicea TaxID=979145 RepID=A0ABR1H0Q9_9HYPO
MSGPFKRSSSDVEKTDLGYDAATLNATNDGAPVHIQGLETSPETSLHRGLKARHITMIAIGGAIGTGLIIGTGKALAQAGPGSVFICYTIIGFVVFLVMAALGEMAAWLPISAGFTGYASRFCDPSLGFALGWTYWFKYIIVTPNQLTAAALVIQYWVPREKVNPGVFIAIFLVVIICINYFGIKFFGEFEFWLSSFKVITIIGIILFSFILVLGGGPDHDRKGFRYWNDPGAFKPYLMEGSSGRFLGFWSCMVNATFAYLGTELVGVTVAEAQNPRKTIPRAIKLTFYRILFFYCLSVLLVGMLVPYDSDELVFATKERTGASASPFVVAADLAGIRVLPHIINACICVFVFSASNSDLYIASRTLYGLASNGQAPAIFKRTDSRGVPIYALAFSALFGCLAFMNVSDDSTKVFGYFVNLTTIFGLLTWISILVTHIHWCKARKAQNIPNEILPYVAPLGIYGSYGALAVCVLVALTKNFDVFVGGDFGNEKYKTFITGYLGIPIYLALIFGHKILKKTRGHKPHEVDFYTGKDIIDNEENEFLARKAALKEAKGPSRGGWIYKTFLSWLF